MLKFGKTPASGTVTLKFADVFDAALPVPPAVFGHETGIQDGSWQMLANDQWGDCVFAGAAHEHMLWTVEGGAHQALFTSADVLSDYSALTGFDPTKPATDRGTDMAVAAAYRQKTGIRDNTGARHLIDAYAALKVGDLTELALATWLFGATGVGFNCPQSMQDQFNNNRPWDVVVGDSVEGGHYIPCVGRNSAGNFIFVTWGRLQAATPAWVTKYMDEGLAYISLEILSSTTKLSPENYNLDALTEYLKEIP